MSSRRRWRGPGGGRLRTAVAGGPARGSGRTWPRGAARGSWTGALPIRPTHAPKETGHGIHPTRHHGHHHSPAVHRGHELREGLPGLPPVGHRPGRHPGGDRPRPGAGRQLHRHRQRLRLWHERGVHRRLAAQPGCQARGRGPGLQGLLQRGTPVTRGHRTRDRRDPEASGHRLPRPLHHPPLRLRHPDRGDHGGPRCPRALREGPGPGGIGHVRLPAAQHAGGG